MNPNEEQLLEQEMQSLKQTMPPQPSMIHQKRSQNPGNRNMLSRISHLSVHNFNTALYYIQENWKSGMAQALLNVPFALNAGNNTGGDPNKGMSSAFIGAFVNGFFSGSNHSIYVPTFVCAPYNYYLVQQYGFEVVPWVTIIIGITIYISSWFKWHHLMDFMPNYVIEGFYLGIGFLIFNGYIDYAFGLSDMHSNRGFSVYQNRIEMYQEFFKRGDMHYLAGTIIIFLFLYLATKFDNKTPWVLLTSGYGLMIGILYPTEKTLYSVYGNATIKFDFIKSEGPQFQPSFSLLFYLFIYSLPMTFYITIQNLICAKGAESLTGVKCDNDQEMLCVSVTNIVSGIFGCLPCCASIRLYVLNIKVRTTNKWSSILNAFSILLFYGIFGRYFLQMPLYVVSGQIIYCAYLCPTWAYLEMLFRTKRKMIIFKQVIIALLCVYYGAIESTVVGSMFAMLQFAERMSAAASEIVLWQDSTSLQVKQSMVGEVVVPRDQIIKAEDDMPPQQEGSFALYRFNGSLNYINIKNHISQIVKLPESDYIVLSFRYVSVFDDEAIDKLAIMIKNLQSSGREVILTGLHKGMIQEMEYNEFFKKFFKKRTDKFKLLGD